MKSMAVSRRSTSGVLRHHVAAGDGLDALRVAFRLDRVVGLDELADINAEGREGSRSSSCKRLRRSSCGAYSFQAASAGAQRGSSMKAGGASG
jgi:hypothetical protein